MWGWTRRIPEAWRACAGVARAAGWPACPPGSGWPPGAAGWAPAWSGSPASSPCPAWAASASWRSQRHGFRSLPAPECNYLYIEYCTPEVGIADPDPYNFPGIRIPSVFGSESISYSLGSEHIKINWKGKLNKYAWLADLLTRKSE